MVDDKEQYGRNIWLEELIAATKEFNGLTEDQKELVCKGIKGKMYIRDVLPSVISK